MLCPHCRIGTSPSFQDVNAGRDADTSEAFVATGNCTECDGLIVLMRKRLVHNGVQQYDKRFVLYPDRLPPRKATPEVTGEYAEDFNEAALVLDDSPKASAAVSRRLVQHIIREKAGIKKRDLDKEIDEVIAQDLLPADLAHDLDMIRHVGNFGTHPIKSTNTGEVVPVEPGEAEALLDLLDELLEFYFVRPARRQVKRDALNAKLAEAGKPVLKGTPTPDDDPPS